MTASQWTKLLWKLNPRDGGWAYEALYRFNDRVKVRVDIFIHYHKAEASHLRVKVLDPVSLKWNTIVNNPLGPEWALWRAVENSKPEFRWFSEDVEKLLREAELILEGVPNDSQRAR